MTDMKIQYLKMQDMKLQDMKMQEAANVWGWIDWVAC